MAYRTEHRTQQLRSAREARKMSQRELSARSGLTQSHISQIERGTMEPGLGSLVDVARALDLEIVLAPKKLMPAIRNIVDSTSTSSDIGFFLTLCGAGAAFVPSAVHDLRGHTLRA